MIIELSTWLPPVIGFAAGITACDVADAAERIVKRRGRTPRPSRPGPDLLCAFVFGDSIPDLKNAALAKAGELYGPAAELEIVRVGAIDTPALRRNGLFCTHVYVRCLNYGGEVDL